MAFNFAGFAAAQEMGQQLNADLQSKQEDVQLKKQQVQQNNLSLQQQQQKAAAQKQAQQQMSSYMQQMDKSNSLDQQAAGAKPDEAATATLQKSVKMYRDFGRIYLDADPAKAEQYFKLADSDEMKLTGIQKQALDIRDKTIKEEGSFAGSVLDGSATQADAFKYVLEHDGASAAAKMPTEPLAFKTYWKQKQNQAVPATEQVAQAQEAARVEQARQDRISREKEAEKDRNLRRQDTAVQREFNNTLRSSMLDIAKSRESDRQKDEAAKHPTFTEDQKQSIGAQVASGEPVSALAGYSGSLKSQYNQLGIDYLMKTEGLSPAQAGAKLAQNGIEYAAGKHSESQLSTMLGATKQATDQLDYNIGQVQKDFTKIKSSDISPVVNAIARGEEKWAGDPAYSSLFYHMHATAMESARILSGGQASIAQLNQGAADIAAEWANTNMTPKSFNEGVAPAMIDEGKNRIETFKAAKGYQKVGGEGSKPTTKAVAAPKPYSDASKEAAYQAWKKANGY